MAAAAAGSIGTAVASSLIVNQNLARPETISLVMATTGGLGAYLTDGNARVAFTGMGAAGAGQLALAYLGRSALAKEQQKRPDAPVASTEPPRKSATGGGIVADLFRDAAIDLDLNDDWRHRDDGADGVYRDDDAGYDDVA
jgi:hypothetical protein